MLALADLLLQNTYCGCLWIFAAENTFFQPNLLFIGDSRTGFCSEVLRKQELNLKSSHWNSFVKKKVFLEFLRLENLIRLEKFLKTYLQDVLKMS